MSGLEVIPIVLAGLQLIRPACQAIKVFHERRVQKKYHTPTAVSGTKFDVNNDIHIVNNVGIVVPGLDDLTMATVAFTEELASWRNLITWLVVVIGYLSYALGHANAQNSMLKEMHKMTDNNGLVVVHSTQQLWTSLGQLAIWPFALFLKTLRFIAGSCSLLVSTSIAWLRSSFGLLAPVTTSVATPTARPWPRTGYHPDPTPAPTTIKETQNPRSDFKNATTPNAQHIAWIPAILRNVSFLFGFPAQVISLVIVRILSCIGVPAWVPEGLLCLVSMVPLLAISLEAWDGALETRNEFAYLVVVKSLWQSVDQVCVKYLRVESWVLDVGFVVWYAWVRYSTRN